MIRHQLHMNKLCKGCNKEVGYEGSWNYRHWNYD